MAMLTEAFIFFTLVDSDTVLTLLSVLVKQ